MTDDFLKVKQIVQQALKLPVPEQSHYLDSACAEVPHLRAEAESLLAAFQEANSFLESPIAKGEGLRQLLTPPNYSTAEVARPARGSDLASEKEIRPGICLKERYLIKRKIGQGGIGVVYLAQDQEMHGRSVVVKVLHARSSGEWARRKFLHESEALTRVTHPGVVKVLDRGVWEETVPFLVMEFIDGVTLRSLIEKQGMPFAQIAEIVAQIGDALEGVHFEGIFHRDLKPDNIMVQRLSGGGEQVKLIDFGIAKVLDPVSADTTQGEMNVGTLAYMAPEQLERGECSAASDMYAFGVLLFEMLTGQKPKFEGLRTINPGLKFTPKDLRPEVSDEVSALVKQALAYDPKNRPESPRDWGAALAKVLTPVDTVPEPTHTQPTLIPEAIPLTEPAPPPDRFFPSRKTYLGLGLVGLLVVYLVGFFLFGDSSQPAPRSVPPKIAREKMSERIRFWLEIEEPSKIRKRGNEEMPVAPDQPLWLHFMPAQAGYLYLLTNNKKNQTVVLFPQEPPPGKKAVSSFLNPKADFRYPPLDWGSLDNDGTPTSTITAIFSPVSLDNPAFFAIPPQKALSAQQVREFVEFRGRYSFPVQKVKPTGSEHPFATVLSAEPAFADQPLVFEIVIQHQPKTNL